MSIAQHSPPRTPLSFGTVRADDDTAAALAYEPLDVRSAATQPWDGDEREEWAAAELRDEMAQRGYW